VQQFFGKKNIPVITQSPHSPNIASSDFWLFPTVKMALNGDTFRNHEGHHIECDYRTQENSKRSLQPVLPTTVRTMEQLCVCAWVCARAFLLF
jgi:hypothetical protein